MGPGFWDLRDEDDTTWLLGRAVVVVERLLERNTFWSIAALVALWSPFVFAGILVGRLTRWGIEAAAESGQVPSWGLMLSVLVLIASFLIVATAVDRRAAHSFPDRLAANLCSVPLATIALAVVLTIIDTHAFVGWQRAVIIVAPLGFLLASQTARRRVSRARL